MSTTEHGQAVPSPAEVYEALFVPALMQAWTGRVADAARLRPGQRVLDVACGTGVLTRALVERVGPGGTVVGVDANEGMLAVARRTAPDIKWRQGRAESLPFDDQSFDAVASQFGLMFFANRQATAEMARVLRPDGRLAVAVWGRLEDCPGYATFTELVQRQFGDAAAAGLRASFALGDSQRLLALFDDVGLADVALTTADGTVRFPSIHSMVLAEVDGWGLGETIDEAQVAQLLQQAERALQPFVTPDGTVTFPIRAHIVSARKA